MNDETRKPSPLAVALSKLDRTSVTKSIDAGAWKSTSVDDVREVANTALAGTGLTIYFSKHKTKILEDGHLKCIVKGRIEHGTSGESRKLSSHVIAESGGRQPLEQRCGSLISYAAKNAIVGALNLPRGGDDAVELAHQKPKPQARKRKKKVYEDNYEELKQLCADFKVKSGDECVTGMCKAYKVESIEEMSSEEVDTAIVQVKTKLEGITSE